jgi:O-antigen/teichoic acid export membrane protein
MTGNQNIDAVVTGDAQGGDPPVLPGSSSLMKTVFRNSVWSTFAVIATPILQFLFGGLTLRYVGVEAAGFSLAVGAVLGLAGRFGTCGIGEAALPAIASSLAAGDERRVRRLIGVVLSIFAASSIVAAIILLACAGRFVHWSKSPVPVATAVAFISISCLSHVFGQMNLALITLLRAAGRYDLVTAVTTPLSLVSGVFACALVPLFPSLITVALLGLASAGVGVVVALAVACRAMPLLRRPLLGLGELPPLARYGFWFLLTHIFATLTGGVDDLVITGTCGAAVVPPWAIGKRLWLTAHTFLAQHAEHLIPTLGGLRHRARETFDGVANAMHWYLMLLAAIGYTLMAWWGEVIVGFVAGGEVAALCRPAIFAYSVLGIGYAAVIMPVITGLAEGNSRPSFIVALLSNCAQLSAVYLIAVSLGAPAVYYAPLVAFPVLLLATGTTTASVFDARAAWSRLAPVAIPLGTGVLGAVASAAAPVGTVPWQRMAIGGVLAASVVLVTIGMERMLSINEIFHDQLRRVLRHTLESVIRVVALLMATFKPNRITHQPKETSL